MKNVEKIIEKLFGSVEAFAESGQYIRVENDGWMPLTIEVVGHKSYGIEISVAHYGEMNGDAMRDPEMVFIFQRQDRLQKVRGKLEYKRVTKSKWSPIYFRNDYAGYEQSAPEGYVLSDKEFPRIWNKNIGEQGFVKAASKASIRGVAA